jgi:HrpA-like RNA helicase
MFTSKASERQRTGRAGRVRPGLALHLYSKQRSAELQARPAQPPLPWARHHGAAACVRSVVLRYLLACNPCSCAPFAFLAQRTAVLPAYSCEITHYLSETCGGGVQEFQQPELKRTPLAELCLQVKLVAPGTPVATFLARALDPPVPQAVEAAVQLLQARSGLYAAGVQSVKLMRAAC